MALPSVSPIALATALSTALVIDLSSTSSPADIAVFFHATRSLLVWS